MEKMVLYRPAGSLYESDWRVAPEEFDFDSQAEGEAKRLREAGFEVRVVTYEKYPYNPDN